MVSHSILAAGEIMARVQWLRIMTLSGYVEPDGRGQDFSADPGECVGLPGERVARPPHILIVFKFPPYLVVTPTSYHDVAGWLCQ
jgi:hypothetical protein